MSKEKKLTDEEMLNRLELYARDGIWWDGIVEMHDILDLIHRLQNNYSNLKEKYVKMLDLNEKTLTKQQTEIERLTEEKDKYQEKWQTAYMNELNLQKQVDELMKNQMPLSPVVLTEKQYVDLKAKNAELQQQVDELKSENTELYKEHTILIAGSILKQQDIAKDTAKEILTELDLFFNGTTFRKGYEFKKINEKLKEIAKRNGVEIE